MIVSTAGKSVGGTQSRNSLQCGKYDFKAIVCGKGQSPR